MNGDGWHRGRGVGWHTVSTNPIGIEGYNMIFRLEKMVRNPKRKITRNFYLALSTLRRKKTDEPQPNNVAEIEREPIETTAVVKADKSLMSPLEILRPLPKAPQRKNAKRNNRKRRSTAILTDTPIKDALEEEKASAKRKQETPDDESDSFNTSGEEDVDWAEINPYNFEELERDLKIDDFLLVKIPAQKEYI
ncbi:hypothetical protein JTB14_033880 [Gonioctena quinquepunctata]|nr:hypothetical protein JTB14_033880 [Gonioctena quinquepunctata]